MVTPKKLMSKVRREVTKPIPRPKIPQEEIPNKDSNEKNDSGAYALDEHVDPKVSLTPRRSILQWVIEIICGW